MSDIRTYTNRTLLRRLKELESSQSKSGNKVVLERIGGHLFLKSRSWKGFNVMLSQDNLKDTEVVTEIVENGAVDVLKNASSDVLKDFQTALVVCNYITNEAFPYFNYNSMKASDKFLDRFICETIEQKPELIVKRAALLSGAKNLKNDPFLTDCVLSNKKYLQLSLQAFIRKDNSMEYFLNKENLKQNGDLFATLYSKYIVSNPKETENILAYLDEKKPTNAVKNFRNMIVATNKYGKIQRVAEKAKTQKEVASVDILPKSKTDITVM